MLLKTMRARAHTHTQQTFLVALSTNEDRSKPTPPAVSHLPPTFGSMAGYPLPVCLVSLTGLSNWSAHTADGNENDHDDDDDEAVPAKTKTIVSEGEGG